MTVAGAGPATSIRHRRIISAWIGRPLLALWRILDLFVPKRMDRWAFFGHPLKSGQLIENPRAVYEHVRRDPSVECVVFLRGAPPPADLAANARTRVHELGSLSGLWALARCGVLLLSNSVAMDLSLSWRGGGFDAPRPWLGRRVVVNLWHGIPLKRLFALANPRQRDHGDRVGWRRRERRHYDGLVASSDVDSHAMAAIFHPLPPSRVWTTGLPRNDFLRMHESDLPDSLRAQMQRLRTLLDGRRLVLYAPTYRDTAVARDLVYRFSDAEVQRLRQLLRRHDAVLGVRGHYLANAPGAFDPARQVDGRHIVSLDHDAFEEIAPLLRQSSVVVTDYSSVYIDALYLERPVLAFAYDLEHYRSQQNGLLYDMELAFPGPVATDFGGFITALDHALQSDPATRDPRYPMARRMFFRYDDARNAQRLVQHLHAAIAARGART